MYIVPIYIYILYTYIRVIHQIYDGVGKARWRRCVGHGKRVLVIDAGGRPG